jgi:Asp-tRNA(Asn)/Glu-tRNA(Gln) amidotransferase A subunit family amidase
VGVYGPMAASIDDLALAYRVMAAPPPAEVDAVSSGFPHPLTTIPPVSTESTSTKTIGIAKAWVDRADPKVRAFFDAAVDFYRKQKGYEVVDIEIPYLIEGQHAHAVTILAEIATRVRPEDMGHLLPHTKLLLSVSGSKSTGTDLIAAQKLRNLLMRHLAHLFRKYPGLVILTPTVPIPGWKIQGGEKDLAHGVSDGKMSTRSMEYVWLANFTGCPAINSPVGYEPHTNVPIGIMGMGEWGSEEALFTFARDGESILDLDVTANDAPLVVGKGLRTPRDPSHWVDVIAEAEKKTKQSGVSASKL